MNGDKPRENLWKVVVNGNAGAGKTSMLVQFVEGSFEGSRTSVTIQGEFLVKELKKFENTGKDVRLQIFDTAGQEKFRTITSSYYRGAMGAILVFDIANKASFDALGGWFEDINHYLPEVPKIVVGNKSDLEKTRAISTNEGQEFAKKVNAPYFETSAKTGDGVNEVFFAITRMMNEEEVKLEKSRNRGMRIQPQPTGKKARCDI